MAMLGHAHYARHLTRVIVDEDRSPRTTTPYSLGCIPYSLVTLVLVIASNPAVLS